ncbi:MAG: GNAT family N-acetyltransferase [Mycobacteriales bacterium]
MADVSVRPARPEDAERVARVQLSTWRTAYGDLLPQDALDLPLVQVAAVWLNAIEAPPSPQHRVLVALDGGELVGFAASEPTTDDDLLVLDAVELTALLVEPRWGRRGHGSRLLAACVEHWRGDGATVAVHWAFEADTVTAGFLESAGWAFDGLGRGLDTGPQVVPQRRLHVGLTES